MNLKLQNLGKAISIRKNPSQPRVVEVKAHHFNRLKTFSAIALVLTLALTVTIVRLSGKTQQQIEENNRLQAQIAQLKSQVSTAVSHDDSLNIQTANSSSKAVGYIESIQSKLKRINDYLHKRGLNAISFRKINVNPETGKPKLNDEQLYGKYDSYLTQLVSDVSLIPMGYPRISTLTSLFGYRSNPFDFGANEFHPGIDFKGHIGDLVKCTASGRVSFTGRAGGYGNCIHIKHANNIETWYGHLSHIDVREGQHVNVGDVIGRVGSTGRSTGPHLHYEVRKNGRPVNPVQYLSLNE